MNNYTDPCTHIHAHVISSIAGRSASPGPSKASLPGPPPYLYLSDCDWSSLIWRMFGSLLRSLEGLWRSRLVFCDSFLWHFKAFRRPSEAWETSPSLKTSSRQDWSTALVVFRRGPGGCDQGGTRPCNWINQKCVAWNPVTLAIPPQLHNCMLLMSQSTPNRDSFAASGHVGWMAAISLLAIVTGGCCQRCQRWASPSVCEMSPSALGREGSTASHSALNKEGSLQLQGDCPHVFCHVLMRGFTKPVPSRLGLETPLIHKGWK